MAELMTKNKALPGDSPDYLFIYFPSIKSKSMFYDVVFLRVFFGR
jgi:hypothetical protein